MSTNDDRLQPTVSASANSGGIATHTSGPAHRNPVRISVDWIEFAFPGSRQFEVTSLLNAVPGCPGTFRMGVKPAQGSLPDAYRIYPVGDRLTVQIPGQSLQRLQSDPDTFTGLLRNLNDAGLKLKRLDVAVDFDPPLFRPRDVKPPNIACGRLRNKTLVASQSANDAPPVAEEHTVYFGSGKRAGASYDVCIYDRSHNTRGVSNAVRLEVRFYGDRASRVLTHIATGGAADLTRRLAATVVGAVDFQDTAAKQRPQWWVNALQQLNAPHPFKPVTPIRVPGRGTSYYNEAIPKMCRGWLRRPDTAPDDVLIFATAISTEVIDYFNRVSTCNTGDADHLSSTSSEQSRWLVRLGTAGPQVQEHMFTPILNGYTIGVERQRVVSDSKTPIGLPHAVTSSPYVLEKAMNNRIHFSVKLTTRTTVPSVPAVIEELVGKLTMWRRRYEREPDESTYATRVDTSRERGQSLNDMVQVLDSAPLPADHGVYYEAQNYRYKLIDHARQDLDDSPFSAGGGTLHWLDQLVQTLCGWKCHGGTGVTHDPLDGPEVTKGLAPATASNESSRPFEPGHLSKDTGPLDGSCDSSAVTTNSTSHTVDRRIAHEPPEVTDTTLYYRGQSVPLGRKARTKCARLLKVVVEARYAQSTSDVYKKVWDDVEFG